MNLRLRVEQPETPRRRAAWFVVAVVAAVLVGGLVLAVGTRGVQRRDLTVLVQLHTWLQQSGLLGAADETADWISQWLGPGPHLIPLTLLAALLAARVGRLRLALFVPVCFGLGTLAQSGLKDLVDRARPNLYPAMAQATGPSFPSGHAVGAICAIAVPLLAMAWISQDRWLRWMLVVAAVLATVGLDLARLVLAVHWPTDVLAGNLLAVAVCAALAAALGLPFPMAPRRAAAVSAFWDATDPMRPEADHGVAGNRRLTATTGAVQLVILAVVILSGVAFGSVPGVHFVSGFVAVPLTVLKLGSTGYRFTGYYLRRQQSYRSAGPPTILPRLLAPALVASALVAFATGVALFFQNQTRGSMATLHTDSAVVFIVLVLIHVAVHARTTWLAAAADVRRPGAVPGGSGRWALLVAASVAGVVLAVGVTLGHPWADHVRESFTPR